MHEFLNAVSDMTLELGEPVDTIEVLHIQESGGTKTIFSGTADDIEDGALEALQALSTIEPPYTIRIRLALNANRYENGAIKWRKTRTIKIGMETKEDRIESAVTEASGINMVTALQGSTEVVEAQLRFLRKQLDVQAAVFDRVTDHCTKVMNMADNVIQRLDEASQLAERNHQLSIQLASEVGFGAALAEKVAPFVEQLAPQLLMAAAAKLTGDT